MKKRMERHTVSIKIKPYHNLFVELRRPHRWEPVRMGNEEQKECDNGYKNFDGKCYNENYLSTECDSIQGETCLPTKQTCKTCDGDWC